MATETKFTPGPWNVVERYGYLSVQQALTPILRLSPVGDYEQTEANAYLTAAAPDLYAALDEALAALYGAISVCGAIGNLTHARDLAQSALAKARGEVA